MWSSPKRSDLRPKDGPDVRRFPFSLAIATRNRESHHTTALCTVVAEIRGHEAPGRAQLMDEETGMMAWNPNPLVRTPMASISPTAMTTVVKSSTPLAEAAVKLGDSQRKYLGPMPYAAWNEAFEHGRVTAAVSENQLLGYVMVRLPRKEVAIAHLAVAPEAQRKGVARSLIHAISERYADRTGIRARCRRDYPANQVWPALGFTALSNLPGRGSKGQLLTLWWLDHGHQDLLTWAGSPAEKLPVLIDANVFIDLHTRTPDHVARTTRANLDRVRDFTELLVAPETAVEINRSAEAAEREPLLSVLHNQYPRLVVPPPELEGSVAQLAEGLRRPPSTLQDRSDLRQVATALASDIPVVITRDRRARNWLAGAAFDIGQMVVTTPAELVAIALAGADEDAYVPSALRNTDLVVHEVRPEEVKDLTAFMATGASERRGDFEARLDDLAMKSPSASRMLIRDGDGEPVALCGVNWDSIRLEVPVLRLASSSLQSTLAVELTDELRRLATSAGAHEVAVTDPHLHRSSRAALLRDGFEERGASLVGVTIQGLVSQTDLRLHLERLAGQGIDTARHLKLLQERWSADSAMELEHILRPCRITDAPIPTWLISIRPQYADDLFGFPPNLLSRPTQLGLGQEQVYYRGGRSGERSPGRVLWRLAGPSHEGVFACSSLVEVRDGAPSELYARFKRLGVWNLEQLTAGIKKPRARALRVRDTQLLPSPVALSHLRSIAEKHGQSLQLQSPCRVEARVFEEIMEAGTRG